MSDLAKLLPMTAVQVLRLYVANAITRQPDPHLGRKVALHVIASVGVLLVLVSGSVAAVDIAGTLAAAGPVAWWGTEQRAAAGFAAAGAVYWLGCEAALTLGTNDRRRPAVRRAAVGTRFAARAMVCMNLTATGFVVGFEAMPPAAKGVAQFAALAGVWFPAAGGHFWRMTRPDAAEAA